MHTTSRHRYRLRRLAALSVLAVVLAACAGPDAGADGGEDAPAALSLSTGTGPLPPAEFGLLEDPSTTVSTADWTGTPSVVNFWATWCAFCVEEMPDLQAAHLAYGDAVRFVGIDRQDPLDDARAFLAESGVTYLNVVSPAGEYYNRIGARGMPTTLFVDEEGVVRYRHTGPLTEERVYELVAEHLGVAPPAA